jgi:hypothetical protein
VKTTLARFHNPGKKSILLTSGLARVRVEDLQQSAEVLAV